MQIIHIPRSLRISLFAILAIVVGLSCSEKITNNTDSGGNVSIELRATPRSTALSSVVNIVVLTVSADDFIPSIVDTLPYDGMPLAFSLDIPAGSNRHFHVGAYKSDPNVIIIDTIIVPPADTTIDTIYGTMTLIYEGSTITSIGGTGNIAVPVQMMAVVPIIRIYPHKSIIASGIPIELKVEAFMMPGLHIAEFQITQNGTYHYTMSVSPGSSVDTTVDSFDRNADGDWNHVYIEGRKPLADAEGYSHLATLVFQSRAFVGEDELAQFSVMPIKISDTLLTDPKVSIYYETSDIVRLGLPDTLVSFPDSELTRLIVNAVEIQGQLSLGDVLRVNSLNAAEAGISDLTNISSLMNADYLNLNANSITDPSPLSGMANLGSIELGSNQITDISELRDLPYLYSLRLAYNQITDLSPLLTNNMLNDWSSLDVTGNPLDDNSINVVIPALIARGIRVTNGIGAQ